MAKTNNAPALVEKDTKKTTCRISFKSSKEMQDSVGDLELKEEITLTVKGTINSLRMEDSENYTDASIELDVSSVNGKTASAKKNDEELEDMTSEKE